MSTSGSVDLNRHNDGDSGSFVVFDCIVILLKQDVNPPGEFSGGILKLAVKSSIASVGAGRHPGRSVCRGWLVEAARD